MSAPRVRMRVYTSPEAVEDDVPILLSLMLEPGDALQLAERLIRAARRHDDGASDPYAYVEVPANLSLYNDTTVRRLLRHLSDHIANGDPK